MVEQEAPATDGESSDKPPSPTDEREESKEGSNVPTEEPVERLLEEIPAKGQPAWCRQILQEAEGHAAPKGTFGESRKPQRYSGLVAQVDPIICEPSSFEEATKLQVWKDAILEEYKSILTNDICGTPTSGKVNGDLKMDLQG